MVEYEIIIEGNYKWIVVYVDGKYTYMSQKWDTIYISNSIYFSDAGLIEEAKTQLGITNMTQVATGSNYYYPGSGRPQSTPTLTFPTNTTQFSVPAQILSSGDTSGGAVIGDYNVYQEINKNEVKEITKEEYDRIREKELKDAGIDVYEIYDDPQDADEIITEMEFQNEIDMEAADLDLIQPEYVIITPGDEKCIDTTQEIKPNKSQSGKAVSCSDINESNFSMDMWLSKYYTLGQLIPNKKHIFIEKTFNGVTYNKFDYACNLKALAVNIIDRVQDTFSIWGLTITSTYRNDNKGRFSQHEIGQAVDMIFTKRSQKEYVKVAQWIQTNLDYDQLLFEYREPNSVWIHVSYNSKGNRNESAPYPKYATFLNDKTYKRLAIVTVPNFTYRT